jgi:hypothetical protein
LSFDKQLLTEFDEAFRPLVAELAHTAAAACRENYGAHLV